MDFRFAFRGLRRAPGFSALIIATLALGIAATTTMFSVVWAVFLRPLPFPAQDRLVTVWEADAPGGDTERRVTPANFVDWESQTTSFEALGALPNWMGEPWAFNVVGPNGLERVHGIYASSGFFKVAGVAPMLGRVFGPEEDRTRGRRRIIISHGYWQSRFAGSSSIIGQTLGVDTFRGGSFEIIGVMPAGFDLPRGAAIWLSLGDWGGGPMPGKDAADRCCAWYTVFGRLKPGVMREHAAAELTAIARRVSASHPNAARVGDVRVLLLRDTLVGSQKATLYALVGAVACVLLIGCANVANLLLSRGVSRRREVLTRLALGATRSRIARQLFVESLLLGSVGATLGLLISVWSQDVVASTMADRIPLIDGTRLDWIVMGFACAVTLLTSTICGLTPLVDWRALDWSSRTQTDTQTTRRVRQALVIGEVALAVTLVGSAGLFLRTVAKLRAVDVGFDTARTLVVSTDLTTAPLRERGSSARFLGDLIPRLAALPGVRAVAATTGLPFEGGSAIQAITRQEDPIRPKASSPHVTQTAVTPGYFTAMGIALKRGRLFTDDDRADGTLVAIVNETAARRYWPGADPIGKRFAMGSRERFGSFRAVREGDIEWREIIGVVGDIRSSGFGSDIQAEVYYSYKQFPVYNPSIVVRAQGDPSLLVPAIRQSISAASAGAVVTRVRTFEDVADESIADQTLRARLASVFSVLALLLGMLGIYSVMSYTVAQQTREIGIRVALGARPSEVARMVVGRAARLTTAGLAVGLVMAHMVARWISSLFFGVGPTDILTLAATCALLLGAALLASASPARHALRVDPMVALRDE